MNLLITTLWYRFYPLSFVKNHYTILINIIQQQMLQYHVVGSMREPTTFRLQITQITTRPTLFVCTM